MTIKDLNPQSVWKNFYSLTQIPRPSKKEGKVSEYLYNFGKSLGLETFSSPTTSDWIRIGCDAVKMGPGMSERSHKKDEYITRDEIASGISGYIAFLETFFRIVGRQ